MKSVRRNVWIIYTFFLGLIHISESAFLRCYNGSLDNYHLSELSEPTLLVKPSCLDLSLPTVFYTFGYRGKVDGPATTTMLTAYLKEGKKNLIVLDWAEEAKTQILGEQLSYVVSAVPNAKKVGIELGDALVKMAKDGLSLNDVHLIGHSLGAHVMGHAGRRVRALGYTIARITGLDPARILFEGVLATQKGLDRSCARFIDIIHTDPGGYGSNEAKGTVDFWPNYSRPKKRQPGCPEGIFEMFSNEDLCDHNRAVQYFAEAIANPTTFPGAQAADYDAWVTEKNVSTVTYLGDLVNTRIQGNFFLTTNAAHLYGRSEKGLVPDDTQSSRRRYSPLPLWLTFFR